jgi:pimeloyl-ACP methyl ester carboxylesterase
VVDVNKAFVEIGGINVAFVEAGQGAPVVLVHGWPTYSHLWRRQIPALAERYHVYALDLPGFGDSDKPADASYTLDFYVEILAGFLDKMKLERVRLVCHDLGGAISLLWAERYPERVAQLAVLDTTPYPDLPLLIRLMLIAARLPGVGGFMVSRYGLRLVLKLGTARKGAVTDELVAAYNRPYTADPPARRVLQRILTELDKQELSEVARNLGRIKAPTLIVWAEKDPSAPLSIAHRLQADIAGSTLKTIPDCGHFLTEDQPDAVTGLLADFFDLYSG